MKINTIQEEFNQFFREIIEKYKKNVMICENCSSNYKILDENGDWLFDVNCDTKNKWFWYNHSRIHPLFNNKFGINKEEINKLMISVLEEDFKLFGIIPYAYVTVVTLALEQDFDILNRK